MYYRVFPDFCSTGIWTEEANAEVPEYVSPITRAALHSWHLAWELSFDKHVDETCLSELGKDAFIADGLVIVEQLNKEAAEYGDKYELVFDNLF